MPLAGKGSEGIYPKPALPLQTLPTSWRKYKTLSASLTESVTDQVLPARTEGKCFETIGSFESLKGG